MRQLDTGATCTNYRPPPKPFAPSYCCDALVAPLPPCFLTGWVLSNIHCPNQFKSGSGRDLPEPGVRKQDDPKSLLMKTLCSNPFCSPSKQQQNIMSFVETQLRSRFVNMAPKVTLGFCYQLEIFSQAFYQFPRLSNVVFAYTQWSNW